MRTVVLKRMNVQEILEAPPETEMEVPDSRAELAERTKTELGYDVLVKQIEQERIIQAKKRTKREVLKTLSKIGPDAIPFEAESVENYKKKMTRKHSYRDSKYKIMLALAITFLIAGLISPYAMGVAAGTTNRNIWGGGLLASLAALGLFLLAGLVAPMNYSVFSAEWKRKRLSGLDQMIPEFALETALAVKERLPEANFWVEELQQNKKTVCPFFGITLNGCDFYLEVWNEPGFKTKRLA